MHDGHDGYHDGHDKLGIDRSIRQGIEMRNTWSRFRCARVWTDGLAGLGDSRLGLRDT